jgi:cobalt-zinc-cadmium efflux system outer membrane protein
MKNDLGIIWRGIVIWMVLSIGITAKSQDSLTFYLNLAAKNNPTVLQKFNEYQAALQKVPQVGGLPDPEINAGVFLSPMELVNGNQVADLRLMQMFPWFGTRRAAKEEMNLMAKAKYESFRDAKLQVFYEIQSTWYDLYKVHQNIDISEKDIEILQAIERLALVKFGSASLVDLYRIKIEMGELDNATALLKSQQNTLVAQFNNYLNRPEISPVSLPDTLLADSLDISIQAISDSMLVNSPMLGMLHYEHKSLDYRKKMVSKMGFPMIGLGLNYAVIRKNEMSVSAMNGKDMVMPMVTMSLPIYRKKYKAMQTEADFLQDANEQGIKATANNLKTEYYQAIQLFRDSQRRIALYSNQSMLAGKSLEIMMKSFSVSGAWLTDLLRIQQQTLDYEYKKVEAVVDYNTSIAWLHRLMAFQQIQ